MINYQKGWHGRPMSWSAATDEHETHRVQSGGIKQGFSGFVPRAAAHFGSSHMGGLPFRDGEKFQQTGTPNYAVKRNFPQKGVNHRSSAEVGRMAWNVEWSDSRRLLTLLRPAELEKYNMSRVRDYGSGKNSRDFEGGVNLLEKITGLDLDRDGDVGAKGNAAAQRSQTSSSVRSDTPPTAATAAARAGGVPTPAAPAPSASSTPRAGRTSSQRCRAIARPTSHRLVENTTPKSDLHMHKVEASCRTIWATSRIITCNLASRQWVASTRTRGSQRNVFGTCHARVARGASSSCGTVVLSCPPCHRQWNHTDLSSVGDRDQTGQRSAVARVTQCSIYP